MSLGEVHVLEDPAWPVARLVGQIDLSNVEELRVRLERAVGNRATGLVLDLSEVTFLDSTGLRLVFRLARELADRQQSLQLVVPDDSLVKRVLTLTGVGAVAEVVAEHGRPVAVEVGEA